MEYNKRVVDYTEYGVLINKFVDGIIDFGLEFEWVYGEPRGALPIVTHVSHFLDLDIVSFVSELDEGEYGLVVDDICDTGKTFMETLLHFDELNKYNGNGKLCFASLFYKPMSLFTPDFYVEETSDWIVFPWEKYDEKPNR